MKTIQRIMGGMFTIKNKRFLMCLMLQAVFLSCSNKVNSTDIEEYQDKFSKDNFNINGSYTWKFKLMGVTQTSTHRFFKDRILYEMKGSVYSTKYPMYKLSYNQKDGKWIGRDTDDNIYLIYLKNRTDSTISIYKHKCKRSGLSEAIFFNYPASDTTEDHGWNTYFLNGKEKLDALPFHGMFVDGDTSIEIKDNEIRLENKVIDQLSFHKGERRWVGQYKDQYLQVFFKTLENTDEVELSIHWLDNLKDAYEIKYNTINNWKKYQKK